jgi:hypothetical protein
MGDNAASNKIDMLGSDLPAPTQQTVRLERLLNDHRELCLDQVPKSLPGSPSATAGTSIQPAPGTSIPSAAAPPVLDTLATHAAPRPPDSPQEDSLIASLTRIQRGDLAAVTRGNLALATRLRTPQATNVVRELRGTSLASSLGHVDSAMLDIVALLFDQIFASEELPTRMKRVIGRLQIPILKVALLDNTFLCVNTHPARKLLDCLGGISVGLDGDLDPGSPLYDQLRKTVRELTEGFQDNMDIFARLHEELEGFVAAQNQAADKQVKLVARRIEYRERLALAKAVSQQEIVQRASSGSVPRAVLRFLTEQWVKVMLVAHAKHGDESEAWGKAVATMDLLIWSVRLKHSLAERRTLAAVLPKLLRRLNFGMCNLGIEDDERRRFFARLMRCHTDAMNAAPSTPQNDDVEPAGARLEFSALTIRNPFGTDDIEIEEISLSELSAGGAALVGARGAKTTTRVDGFGRVAASLGEGAWVDFLDESGTKRRARLAYISPLRRSYLFVSARSGNPREYSLDQLVRELRAGRASVVEATSLFDRAMGGLAGAQRSSAALH